MDEQNQNNQKQPAQPAQADQNNEAGNGVVLKSLRTYSEDIKKTLDTQNMSVIKIAVAESKKREQEEKIEVENSILSKKNILILISSILLIALGGGIIAYLIYNAQKTPVAPVVKTDSEVITADSKAEVSVDNSYRRKIIKDVALESLKPVAKGTIKQISFVSTSNSVKKYLNSGDFLSLMEVRVPETLGRFIKPYFIYGVFGADDGNKPFLVLKVTSYDNAYSGMLSWEGDLVDDFVELIKINTGNDAPISLETKSFSDLVIKNKDARVIKDTSGKIIMFYSIVDNETIVFAGDETAFAEVLSRIQLKKLVR
ncbi:hypothetical protein IT397_01860 [Candidatus Nomurabacteria bacterium]|nr:hypothetical protein [Candidatus Nomurabacteria bacterium]